MFACVSKKWFTTWFMYYFIMLQEQEFFHLKIWFLLKSDQQQDFHNIQAHAEKVAVNVKHSYLISL